MKAMVNKIETEISPSKRKNDFAVTAIRYVKIRYKRKQKDVRR